MFNEQEIRVYSEIFDKDCVLPLDSKEVYLMSYVLSTKARVLMTKIAKCNPASKKFRELVVNFNNAYGNAREYELLAKQLEREENEEKEKIKETKKSKKTTVKNA